ncbi:scoloptoxin SSD14-like isoform X2 [Panulirus ornatus]|uniref:scoloptoxin SSD14-like isoform X2 n=1 Tax=Panulirus ornatus TaxID=150431 RepID=UPI003A8698A3
MGRRSKRLRSQLYQYARDEAGSYCVITQWPPPPTTSPPARTRCLTRRQVTCVLVTLLCLILVAIAVALSVMWAINSGASAGHDQRTTSTGPRRSGQAKLLSNTEEVGSQPPPQTPSRLANYHTAAVVADGHPCPHVATEILRKNGSAADAAVAALFCLGVVNTHSAGLGGGFLLTYYERATGKAHSLIARETAPAAAYEDMFSNTGQRSSKGGLAVAVPGELRGYQELYHRFGGKIPWGELLEPAIRLCEEGHTLHQDMARTLMHDSPHILSQPSMSVFINPETGHVYQEGERLRRPQLAKTLRAIQQEPDALYTGHLLRELVQDVQDLGGVLTEEDLRNYRAEWREAVRVDLQHGGFTMYSVPPPGSGLTLALILNILDEFDLTSDSVNDRNIVLTQHRVAEAIKLARTMTTGLADDELTRNLTSDAFAGHVARGIRDDGTVVEDCEGFGALLFAGREEDGRVGEGVQLSLLAPNGDALAVTSTIGSPLGAGLRSTATGIVLNDAMRDFWSADVACHHQDDPSSPSNLIRPGKRPVSLMSPAVFVDAEGDVRLILGAAGGAGVPSSVAWVAVRHLWLGSHIQEAVHANRFHLRLHPLTIVYEEGVSPKVVAGLQQLGHRTKVATVRGAPVCAIMREHDGQISAVSDNRKEGRVDGF